MSEMHDRLKKSEYIGEKLFLNIVHFKRQILQWETFWFNFSNKGVFSLFIKT